MNVSRSPAIETSISDASVVYVDGELRGDLVVPEGDERPGFGFHVGNRDDLRTVERGPPILAIIAAATVDGELSIIPPVVMREQALPRIGCLTRNQPPIVI